LSLLCLSPHSPSPSQMTQAEPSTSTRIQTRAWVILVPYTYPSPPHCSPASASQAAQIAATAQNRTTRSHCRSRQGRTSRDLPRARTWVGLACAHAGSNARSLQTTRAARARASTCRARGAPGGNKPHCQIPQRTSCRTRPQRPHWCCDVRCLGTPETRCRIRRSAVLRIPV
jgi:hypothetical protein